VARTSNSKPIVFKLNCGGTIKFFPGICSAGQIQNLKEEMEEVSVFKQYKVRDCGKEPRVHALFASNGGGYQYGNVKMGSISRRHYKVFPRHLFCGTDPKLERRDGRGQCFQTIQSP
jgi:hypothetical protein